jgi:hypothetical protein
MTHQKFLLIADKSRHLVLNLQLSAAVTCVHLKHIKDRDVSGTAGDPFVTKDAKEVWDA